MTKKFWILGIIFMLSGCGILGEIHMHVRVGETKFRVPGNRVIQVLKDGFLFRGREGGCETTSFAVDDGELHHKLHVEDPSALQSIKRDHLDRNFQRYNMACIGDSEVKTCAFVSSIGAVRISSTFEQSETEKFEKCLVDAAADLRSWEYLR